MSFIQTILRSVEIFTEALNPVKLAEYQDVIYSYIKEKKDNGEMLDSVLLVGHSLGGSVAQVVVGRMYNEFESAQTYVSNSLSFFVFY